jgi:hypothetical protein
MNRRPPFLAATNVDGQNDLTPGVTHSRIRRIFHVSVLQLESYPIHLRHGKVLLCQHSKGRNRL